MRQYSHNGARHDRRSPHDRTRSHPRNYDAVLKDQINNNSRRALAMQLNSVKKESRDLIATSERQQSRVKSLASQNKDLQVNNKQLRDQVATLESNYKRLESIRQKYTLLKSENEELRADLQDSERSHKMRSQQYTFILQNCLSTYGASINSDWDHTNWKSTRELLDLLLQDALEATSLRMQVQDSEKHIKSLQEQLLSSVEKTQAVTDEHFASGFRMLASSIKSLSRSVKLSGTVNIMDIDEIQQSALIKEARQDFCSTRLRQKCMIEAFI
jgi:hypothetical protein